MDGVTHIHFNWTFPFLFLLNKKLKSSGEKNIERLSTLKGRKLKIKELSDKKGEVIKEVAEQIIDRFDKDDRLMCWFDFFNHDNERVKRNMDAFMKKVVPIINEGK